MIAPTVTDDVLDLRAGTNSQPRAVAIDVPLANHTVHSGPAIDISV